MTSNESDSKSTSENSSSLISSESNAKKVSPSANMGAVDPYEGLPENEIAILKAQTATKTPKVTIFTLFRYATALDTIILLIGLFFDIVAGAALPMFTFVVGGITNQFREFTIGELPAREFTRVVNHNCLYFVYIGVGISVSNAIQAFIFNNKGVLLAARYRKAYLEAAMRQNIAYFDHLGSGSVGTRITNDTASIQAAIGDKIGQIVKAIATFVAAFAIALGTQWKLALIGFSCIVWFIIGVVFNGAMLGKAMATSSGIYAKGSNIAEEAFSAARNSIAICAQEKLASRFDVYLSKSRKVMRRASYHMSLMMAVMWSTLGFLYALVSWEGSRLVKNGETTIGHVVTVMVALLVGMFNLAAIAPQIRNLASGFTGAKHLNETIDRIPIIDAARSEGSGKILEKLDGNISINHIHFRYPSRPDVLILPDFSLNIKAGQTIALVGASGSGKSTVVGLLERFYEPLGGKITLDGISLDELNIKWLRQQIGLVSQEPTLFADSVANNVAFGLIGTEYEHAGAEAQRELVIGACKLANAWDFIQTLDQGLETNVGERGFLLSGGQKQRIAIARAIVSDPKILLLDEATSALDTKSEGIVQEALDRASSSRTTIVIAHRLSTIKSADKIVVMSAGRIIEEGTHQELVAARGRYYRLVELQQINQSGKATLTKLERHEDAFIEEDKEEFAAAPIPGMEQRKPGLVEIVKLLWRFNRNERKRLIFACLFSIPVGYAQIAYSILNGRTFEAYMVLPQFFDQMRHEVNITSGFFFMVGVLQLVFGFLVMLGLTSSAEHLLRNVRLSLFTQIMRMDVSFFDVEKNTPGALTAILARDGKAIEGLGGATIGQVLQCLALIFGGAITGIVFNWRLGLVGTACMPIILITGFFRMKILGVLEERNDVIFEKSSSLATSFTNAIRTIQALTRERQVSAEYAVLIDGQVSKSLKATLSTSIIYGISEGIFPWVLGLIWYYGAKLLGEHKISPFHYYVVFLGTIIGANSAVIVFNFMPDVGKAKSSAGNVLRMLEAKPLIDTKTTEGDFLERVEGEIVFQNCYFRYPTRPQVPILRGINLSVKPGQTAALVGASGCGKSTTIGLAERFYDPDSGSILLDGKNIKDINVNNFRSFISLVQQEPTLYSGTIRENLLLGWPGQDSEVTQDMLEEACREANIHNFVTSLPEGYDTDVGGHGILLSGGQKQRIALARALLKKPAILLLDEATSALDAESEKVVQAALDKAAHGRTTISIAHRLSTIQNSDIIYVFDRGLIVEKGTHHELLSLNGRYAELVHLQTLVD